MARDVPAVRTALHSRGIAVCRVAPVPGGWGGLNFRADTSAGPLIVKVRRDVRPLLVAKTAAGILSLRGVPHPMVVLPPTPVAEGWMMAHRWVEGTALDAAGLGDWDEADASRLGADLGVWLRRLHRIEHRGGGWSRAAQRRFADKLHRCLELGIIDADLADAVRRRWAADAAALDAVTPTLIHRDLQPGNIVVRSRHLAAVIDFEQARIADPLYDLVKLSEWIFPLHPAVAPALDEAYGLDRTHAGVRSRLRVVSMLEHLSALVYFAKRNDVAMVNGQRNLLSRVAEGATT
ncbi:aminoglycoside phosphotransferase family protein [Micromonospora craniellae]|uniref:Aminoglycoside phosphotransferase family protein n=1 Tax=Micromonospora craniellae TaxID=2294034 RepID=A0A372FUH3_9ACTN|nr:aminoglycoside phosphotransferase family protein [Micromonospora craniellae]QOC94728.1 aminoglycoside phosphotransferase family protein [Micromonospora craniellae]RFS44405.1 aminoglycoside phosphotransferase family protein [Micromonospora craniellae]